MTIFTRFQLIGLVILSSFGIATAQVKFTAIASAQEIGRGEYLQVEFVIENAKQIDQLTPPDFPGFTVVEGPIQSSGMSIVNGNMSQYKSVSFVLQPTKTGKFTIGGAGAQVDGKHMQSNTVAVTVVAGATGNSAGGGGRGNGRANGFPGGFGGGLMPFPNGPPSNPADVDRDYILKPGENVKEKIKKNMFVKVQVDKTSCYVGEPIVATYKLYSRLSSESRVTKRPSLNGFSVYDMIDPSQDAVSVEHLNGKAYTVHIIRKTQLIPLQSGTIDLDPVEVENTVHFVKAGVRGEPRHSGNTLKDLFDQLSDDDAVGPEVEENITLGTKPLTITVKPLPEENKPAIYTGAVGSFTVQASLNSNSVAAKDEAVLHVVVKGKGNLPVINAPVIQWPSDVDAYDPHAKEDINKTTAPMSGSKSFDYVFTPHSEGRLTIPAVSFSYFDPASQTYKTANSDPMELQVTAAVARSKSAAPPTAAPAATANSGDNVGWKDWIQSHLEWIFAVVILSSIAVWLLRQNSRLRKAEQKQKEELAATAKKAEEALMAEKQAQASLQAVTNSAYSSSAAVVVDPLLDARRLFEDADYKGFYREVNRAVWKAVTKKLDLPASEHNKQNIVRQLDMRGYELETTMLFESILNECEMNLYTPAYDMYNMQQLLRQTEGLLSKIGEV